MIMLADPWNEAVRLESLLEDEILAQVGRSTFVPRRKEKPVKADPAPPDPHTSLAPPGFRFGDDH